MRNLLILLIIALLASCGPEVPRGTNYEMYYENTIILMDISFCTKMRIQRFRPIKPTKKIFGGVK